MNNNYIVGNGPVTNNNWAISIIRIAKEQVRCLAMTGLWPTG